jgi:2-dehydro-3-deoxygalactonokinase
MRYDLAQRTITMAATALIGLDWGTSSARAYRIAADGSVLDTRAAPLGVQKLDGLDYPSALATLLGDWRDDPAPRLASGMVGSRQGWVEAPYVRCPATLPALAEGLVATAGGELRVVPGVTTRDAAGVPDVMRGEETEILGAVGPDEDRVLTVTPGTHSKWTCVEQGRIVDFATFMTGELYAVLIEHSILGRLADRQSTPTVGAAFDRGLARGIASGGLTHDLFGARTLALTGELAPAEVSDWLSGLLIGREIRTARTWAFRAGYDAATVRVIGADTLAERYVAGLARADIAADRGPSHAAARGLWRIAQTANLLQ